MTTNNQFQDLEWARPKIERRILDKKKQGFTATIYGLFSMLRKEKHLSLIGDYFLFWIIVKILKEKKLPLKNLRRTLGYSEEYQELPKSQKMQWGTLLENHYNT